MRRHALDVRPLIAAIVMACALFACASSALAATPSVSLTAKAPIAVRKGASFKVTGSAGAQASVGETVTITFSHKSGGWSVVSTQHVHLSASRTYSASLSANARGHWRVKATLEATSGHLAASATSAIKAVGSKCIALTFDDGPWPTSTAKIVSELKSADVQATFFELGSQIGSRRKLSQSVLAEDNIIGVHSWNHTLMTKRSAAVNQADLQRCIKAVKAATGYTPHWFRPPYGSWNKMLRATAEKVGLKQVLWSVDTLDWKYRVTSSIVSRTMSGARDGSIVLMHDGGGPRAATAAAVPIVIKKLRANGYDFVTLDEMVALGYTVH